MISLYTTTPTRTVFKSVADEQLEAEIFKLLPKKINQICTFLSRGDLGSFFSTCQLANKEARQICLSPLATKLCEEKDGSVIHTYRPLKEPDHWTLADIGQLFSILVSKSKYPRQEVEQILSNSHPLPRVEDFQQLQAQIHTNNETVLEDCMSNFSFFLMPQFLNVTGLTFLPPIPKEFAMYLTHLQLSNNELHVLPSHIRELEGLRIISLNRTMLCRIPDGLISLENLRSLDLMDNFLTELPEGIGNLYQLRDLAISGNKIKELPPSLAQLYLEHFWVDFDTIKASSKTFQKMPIEHLLIQIKNSDIPEQDLKGFSRCCFVDESFTYDDLVESKHLPQSEWVKTALRLHAMFLFPYVERDQPVPLQDSEIDSRFFSALGQVWPYLEGKSQLKNVAIIRHFETRNQF